MIKSLTHKAMKMVEDHERTKECAVRQSNAFLFSAKAVHEILREPNVLIYAPSASRLRSNAQLSAAYAQRCYANSGQPPCWAPRSIELHHGVPTVPLHRVRK